MSGLLPRTLPNSGDGTFSNISTGNLNVAGTAIVYNLIASNLSFTNISATNATISNLATIGSLKITIAPSTSSTIAALTRESDGSITVNSSLVDQSSSQVLTNKTIDSGSNSILITSGPLVSQNINLLIDQDVRQLSNPIFSTVQIGPIPSIQDVTIDKTDAGSCAIHVEGGGQYTFKDGVYDVVGTNISQTLTNKTISGPSATFNNYFYPTILANSSATPLVRDPGTGYIGLGSNFLTVTNPLPVQNKTIDTDTTNFGDYSSTQTKVMTIQLGGASNGTDSNLLFTSTATRDFTFPDITGTIIVDVGNQTLQNKTIANLVSTGLTDSMLSGKLTKNYVSGITTVGNVTVAFATIPMTSGTGIIVKCWIMARCTAGTDLGKYRFFDATFAGKRDSLGAVSSYNVVNNNGSDGAFAVTLAVGLSPGVLLINVTGIAGDTIAYSGVYKIINQ